MNPKRCANETFTSQVENLFDDCLNHWKILKKLSNNNLPIVKLLIADVKILYNKIKHLLKATSVHTNVLAIYAIKFDKLQMQFKKIVQNYQKYVKLCARTNV